MGRALRIMPAGVVFHLINRSHEGGRLFEKEGDYGIFEKIFFDSMQLSEEQGDGAIRLYAYTLMPNHWHVLASSDADQGLIPFVQRVTGLHARHWRKHRKTLGRGALYQGRFRSFPVQSDVHFINVARYVEANPLRASLVTKAEEWRWGSLWRRSSQVAENMAKWPTEMPRDWTALVNRPIDPAVLPRMREAVSKGMPYGGDIWSKRAVDTLGLQSALRGPGRPPK
jgi:putative transposase